MKKTHTLIATLFFVLLSSVVFGQNRDIPNNPRVVVDGSVFGGGNLANVAHHSSVIIDQTGALIGEDVYGGGAKANVNTTASDTTGVTLKQGTVTGDVYGGGLGDLESLGEGHENKEALVYGPVTVIVNGGTATNVFGCNNYKGAPQDDVEVYIESGSVLQDVYGGGNLASATATPVVYINGGTVGRDVYGGGALADVGSTTVHVMGGKVTRDIYGGGLGRKAQAAVEDDEETTDVDESQPAVQAIEAKVNGTVHVKIGKLLTEDPETYQGNATIGGSVYGCNNLNGTPTDNVFVDVYRTAHVTTPVDNNYPTGIASVQGLDVDNPESSDYAQEFAIKAVYGGGNQAQYLPTENGKTSTVHIYGCTENTIQTVYGGGNAADVGSSTITAHTHLIIDGGRFDRIFGGGNGFSATDNHHNSDQPNYNPGANISGTATTDIYGGLYRQVFGGSNQYGNVHSTALNIDKSCETLMIFEAFGGANQAVITGDVETTLSKCDVEFGSFYGGSNMANIIGNVTLNVYGGNYINVFGGSKGVAGEGGISAGILDDPDTDEKEGNVTLNLFGGTIDNAFGGSNANGNIDGKITVNMLEQEDCGLTLHNIYGGGRLASYTPDTPGAYPEVNLIHGTVSKKTDGTGGNVYGGGLGSPATVTSNPLVRVGYNATDMSTLVTELLPGNTSLAAASVTVEGNVYGGGDAAPVAGATTVTVQQEASTEDFTASTSVEGDVYGGGNQANVSGSVLVNVTGGTVTQDVYGGGALADVNVTNNALTSGATTAVTLSGGTVRKIYGGGLGRNDDQANSITAVEAKVYGPVTVTVNSGTVIDVFGCNNKNGAPQSSVLVDINSNVSGDVYGGGNLAACALTPVVNINSGIVGGNVFGGGNQAGVGGGSVNMIGGAVLTGIYGGCNTSGTVVGNAVVNVTGGTVGTAAVGTLGEEGYVAPVPANIYGGGLGADTRMSGDVAVNIGATDGEETPTYSGTANIYGDVYGGSAKGKTNCNADGTAQNGLAKTDVTLYSGTVNGDLYGGGHGLDNASADVYGPVTVTVINGTVTNVFGCNNENGAPQGSVQVNIEQGSGTLTVGNVYGGGNLAAYSNSGNAYPEVNIKNGTVANVFGGGLGASATVTANPHVTVGDLTQDGYQAIVTGDVYGGGDLAAVTGPTTVLLQKANSVVGNDIYGGGNLANVTGATTVEITNGTVTRDVYGGGALANTGGSNVTLDGGTIGGDLYGGGLGRVATSDQTAVAAQVTGPVQVTVNAGKVTGAVYGCNNANGDPTGTVKVDIYGTDAPAEGQTYALSQVFGGGNQAAYRLTPEVTIHGCDNKIGEVYGGGNKASVGGTNVVVYGGNTIGKVFAGGNGVGVAEDYVMVSGDAKAYIYGGIIGQVFGGNNAGGTTTGTDTDTDSKLYINKQAEPQDGTEEEQQGRAACTMKIGEVYGGGNLAAGKASEIEIGCTGDWTTEGEHNHTNHNNTDNRIGYELEGIGTVYGGANQADVSNAIELTIESGIVENVFGGNNERGNIRGTVTVNIEKNNNACDWYVGNVYGGGNVAPYTGTPNVNIKAGTVSGKVFGGGNDITTNHLGVGGSHVAMTDGTVLGGVYGGCNENGYVTGNSVVNILGGVIGSQALLNGGTTANVFGGGLGEATQVSGDVTVTVSRATGDNPPAAPTIYGDVYGGSAFGDVNADSRNTTTVNILDGTLVAVRTSEVLGNGQTVYFYTGGNVFGGGLGRKEGNGLSAIAAKVNGKVVVNIGSGTHGTTSEYDGTAFTGNATIEGNVYGGNNTNGSPQDDVTVNVYKTAQTTGFNTVDDEGFAIANVFGGGNEANYAPENGAANTRKKAYVYIHGCYNTVERVFGGGNAAATPGVYTDVQGGRFSQIFGGGNGERGSAYAANINGDLYLAIHGGHVGQFYGISNQNGNVSGNASVVTDNNGPCGQMMIDEFFCGGNFANITGDLTTTITCTEGMVVGSLYGGCNQADITGNVVLNVEGGTFTNVFGGSRGRAAKDAVGEPGDADYQPAVEAKPANIGGNVTLNLYGGTIENVYGGSNENGNINGIVTVNVIDKEGDCPLYITNIYGGSNETDYTPTYTPASGSERISPVVNVVHAKNGISGNVYGGSRGKENVAEEDRTKVVAHPLVNVGYESGMEGYSLPTGSQAFTVPASPRAIIAGSVFGGGDAAKVQGSTKIMLRNRAKVFGNVYGGGNMGEVTGDTKVIVNGANQ